MSLNRKKNYDVNNQEDYKQYIGEQLVKIYDKVDKVSVRGKERFQKEISSMLKNITREDPSSNKYQRSIKRAENTIYKWDQVLNPKTTQKPHLNKPKKALEPTRKIREAQNMNNKNHVSIKDKLKRYWQQRKIDKTHKELGNLLIKVKDSNIEGSEKFSSNLKDIIINMTCNDPLSPDSLKALKNGQKVLDKYKEIQSNSKSQSGKLNSTTKTLGYNAGILLLNIGIGIGKFCLSFFADETGLSFKSFKSFSNKAHPHAKYEKQVDNDTTNVKQESNVNNTNKHDLQSNQTGKISKSKHAVVSNFNNEELAEAPVPNIFSEESDKILSA